MTNVKKKVLKFVILIQVIVKKYPLPSLRVEWHKF